MKRGPIARQRLCGFTLVEILIVVSIIGLLAAIAIPAFIRARRDARIAAFTNDLRLAGDAFEMYAMQNRAYPPDANRGVVPAGMAGYLPSMDWSARTPLGGVWDWERNTLGVGAGISAVGDGLAPQNDFRAVDERLDDGDLAAGRFRSLGDRYTYILEE